MQGRKGILQGADLINPTHTRRLDQLTDERDPVCGVGKRKRLDVECGSSDPLAALMHAGVCQLFALNQGAFESRSR
jgi:hypothetical protein